MNNYSGFESLGAVVNRVAENIGIERGTREIAFVNLWPDIIGPRFKNKSKAVSIINKGTFDVLLVAVNSASLSQELVLHKSMIMNKILKTTKHLKFNIKDIIFSTKTWEEVNKKYDGNLKSEEVHIFMKNPTENELQDINVAEGVIDLIKESIQTQSFSSDELKDRILNTIIKDIKTQIWKKNNGYPCCEKCGSPINVYNPEKEILCPSCLFKDYSSSKASS